MKKFIKINFLLALTLLVFSSCAVDDDNAVIPLGTRITASLDKTGDVFIAPSVGANATVNVVLSQAVDTDSQFTYTVNGAESTVRLRAGERSVPITVANTVGNINTIVLTKAATLYNPNVELGAQTMARLISIPSPQSAATTFVLAWEDAAFDMDFYVVTGDQDIGGTVIDSSLAINTNSETISLDDSAVDQVYSLYVNQFAFTADVPANIIVVKSDGSVSLYSGTVKEDSFVMTFIKSGTDLDFTQLSTFN